MIMKLNLKLAAFALLAVMPLTLQAETGGGNFAASSGTAAGKTQADVTVSVRGTVRDASGVPLPGVVVLVKDRPSSGVMTDADGAFFITVPKGATLVFTCMGYKTIELLASETAMAVSLEEERLEIEETVVVGYGVQRRESVVGAITNVKAEDIAGTGTSLLNNALAGKVPGLLVYSQSGAPGESDATLMIRGLSSWNGSEPLVMVDGIERPMNSISPSDVASVSVLKDASATAVYGAKGANGVILVTTKTGAKGAPKFSVNVNQGFNTPLFIPSHVDAATVASMANIALKNTGSFGSIFSDEVIRKYADQSEPLRYPDVDWYGLLLRDFALSTDADLTMSGGTEKIKYYLGVGYVHDGSIIREITDGTNYSSDRISYRMNMDWNVTRSTLLSLKVGGVTNMEKRLSTAWNSSTVFSTIYQAPTISYPAYYPEWALEQFPDVNYPGLKGMRLGGNQGHAYTNPYSMLADPDYQQTMSNRLMTDIILKQDLDFITKGLSVTGKFGLTSTYSRISKKVKAYMAQYNIDWNMYDAGSDDIWVPVGAASDFVYSPNPYAVTQDNSATNVTYITYLEASLNYSRKFADAHNVTALALYNQRQYNNGAAFPKRNQSFVARATYDYKGRYLFEANLGITGSEQFSPKYRYGIFPSVAVGYVMSKERFWKEAMPWWSLMKFRYSNGLVGSDSSSSNWLYYSSWTKNSYGYIVEDAAANLDARWETAHKQDIGIEMGWLNDRLRLEVDLYDEKRSDMLMAPVVTPFVGVKYKDVNTGALKKHGFEVEINWKDRTAGGFAYNVGAMIGLSENRITSYGDAPYAPEYQKYTGTPLNSARTGSTLVDDRYFNSIDEIHGYPLYTSEWTNVVPGVYKFLDYTADGSIAQNDLHTLRGSTYAPGVYSFNFGFNWKGLSFRTLCTGTTGKYINYRRAAIIPFYSGDYVVHASHLDYWTPQHRNSSVPALSLSDEMYSWAGGTSAWPGYDLALDGYTWKKSDYLTVKEMSLSYTFDGKKLRRALGVRSLSVGVICNNLLTFTSLMEQDPQRLTTAENYYPTMRIVKLNLNLSF